MPSDPYSQIPRAASAAPVTPGSPYRILFTGGGSGGHVYPLIAVAEAVRAVAEEKKIPVEFFYFGPDDEYRNIISFAKIKTSAIVTGKIRRYFSLLNFLDVPKFFIGFLQALVKMFWLMPDVIFSKGGPGALPVVVAGWLYRIPVLVHESDVFPGLTNAVSSRFASRILTSFEATLSYFHSEKAVCVGNPVRSFLFEQRRSQEEAKTSLGFHSDKPLIFVAGGSQGSERLNKFILAHLEILLQDAQIIHQTGRAHYDEVQRVAEGILAATPDAVRGDEFQRVLYKAMPYLNDELPLALAACDFVIGRAGSGNIFEIAAFGKPAILIPLKESANDHQRGNAYEFAKGGAAVVIEEENLMSSIFISQVKDLLRDRLLQEKMKNASHKFFKPNAARDIAGEILRYCAALSGTPRPRF